MNAGPQDVPNGCPVCRQMTLHRPGPDGRLYCLPCMMRAMAPQQQAMIPFAPQVAPPREPPVVQVQQKVGGGVVRSTIDAAKFVMSIIFLFMVGTCLYVCSQAADKSKQHQTSP